jgi:hypothetical protein
MVQVFQLSEWIAKGLRVPLRVRPPFPVLHTSHVQDLHASAFHEKAEM